MFVLSLAKYSVFLKQKPWEKKSTNCWNDARDEDTGSVVAPLLVKSPNNVCTVIYNL